MGAELQSLLDKIQNEGVAKAESEANKIIEEAREKAAAIVADAEKRSAAARAKAEEDAKDFEERARQSLKQAARDVVLGVRSAVDDTLDRILLSGVGEALDGETLATLVPEAVRAYIAQSADARSAAVEVPTPRAEAVRAAVIKEARELAEQGLEVRADSAMRAGFRVTLAEGRLEHDFSAAAIRESLSKLLRPALAELLEQ